MSKSIMQEDSEYCYIHMKYLGLYVKATDEHHCQHGNKRQYADDDGLTIFLCRKCHSLLHDKGIHDLDMQKESEKVWLTYYNKTIPDWIKRYDMNYLDEEDFIS